MNSDEEIIISFPKKTVSDMHKLMRSAISSNKEHSGSLCIDKNAEIHLENKCGGSKFTCDPSSKCSKGRGFIGDIHTHPLYPGTDASATDLIRTYENNKLDCIGITRENKIKCYSRKDEYDKQKHADLAYQAARFNSLSRETHEQGRGQKSERVSRMREDTPYEDYMKPTRDELFNTFTIKGNEQKFVRMKRKRIEDFFNI